MSAEVLEQIDDLYSHNFYLEETPEEAASSKD